MTTVRELIQDLLLMDSDLEVYVASDAEGNGFRHYDATDEQFIVDGEVYDYDSDEESPNAAVIWPV